MGDVNCYFVSIGSTLGTYPTAVIEIYALSSGDARSAAKSMLSGGYFKVFAVRDARMGGMNRMLEEEV